MYQFHQEQHAYSLHLTQEAKLNADSSSSWVMTSPEQEGFVKLPHERILHQSPRRTSLEISSTNPFPGAQPFKSSFDGGIAYITNQRIVFLPSTPTPELQSFSSPILNLQDTYARAPFFGANYWTASCKPVAGGGVPTQHQLVELKLTFREGGAFDFHTVFEQIKERLQHAHSVARESGRSTTVNVDLEQLPAYEAAREVQEDRHTGPAIISPVPVRPSRTGSIAITSNESLPPPPPAIGPDELPPGYEEAQSQSVSADALDQRLAETVQRH